MVSFAEKIAALEAEGYANAPARAKLAHDVVLKAMEKCGFAKNITVKGGVVMSGITGDIRRATMDMDVDFVRYGLTDENIDDWIQRLNCLDGIRIVRSGDITDLRHQNYHGKRVYLDITDSAGVAVSTKLDIGVHVRPQADEAEVHAVRNRAGRELRYAPRELERADVCGEVEKPFASRRKIDKAERRVRPVLSHRRG